MSQDIRTITIIIHFQKESENWLEFLMTLHPGCIRNVLFIYSFTLLIKIWIELLFCDRNCHWEWNTEMTKLGKALFPLSVYHRRGM